MRISTIILSLCIVLGTVFLCTLGIWQLQRLAWKEALIERVRDNLSAAPLSAAEIAQKVAQGQDIEYRPVTVTGTFDHTAEAHYFAPYGGESGYFVYTPLRSETVGTVLVNRGFVPMRFKDPSTRPDALPAGEVTIVGLARSTPQEKPNTFVPNNDLGKNVYHWKSRNQMLSQGGGKPEPKLADFFIDANDAPNPGRWPLGGVTRISFPNSHLQYAVTWFGLALTLIFVGGFFLYSRSRQHRQERETSGQA